MMDFHTHSLFSDGCLIPSELVQRARKKGYEAIAITDHADISNIDFIIPRLKKFCKETKKAYKDIACFAGVELTHIPPVLIKSMVKKARKAGADIVVFHGESPVEPVEPDSNRQAILAKVDILAHPGHITLKEAELAKRNNVYLEITARSGHNITNGHVASTAKKAGAELIFDTDAHAPEDLADENKYEEVLKKAGLNRNEIMNVRENAIMLKKRLERGTKK